MQAARGLAAALRSKDGTIQLRLRPAQLGSIRVTVRVDQARVIARIEASSEQARAALETGAAQLRSALQSRGLEVERLEIVHTPAEPGTRADGRGAHFAGDPEQAQTHTNDRSQMTSSHRSSAEADDDSFLEATSAEPIASGPLRVIDGEIRLDALA